MAVQIMQARMTATRVTAARTSEVPITAARMTTARTGEVGAGRPQRIVRRTSPTMACFRPQPGPPCPGRAPLLLLAAPARPVRAGPVREIGAARPGARAREEARAHPGTRARPGLQTHRKARAHPGDQTPTDA